MTQHDEYIALPPAAHLVRGKASGALYQLKPRKLWAVPHFLADALQECAKGVPFRSALAKSLGNDAGESGYRTLRRFVLEHPALELVSSVPSAPRPLPLKKQIEPSWLMLELTASCNLHCCHCYMSAARPTADAPKHTLPAQRWLALIEEGRKIGFRALHVTGGEPLLHPDLMLYLRTAHQLGYKPVALFSNLTVLDDRLLECLAEIGAHVHTSLYSDKPEVHDTITTEAGSHARTLGGLRRVLEKGLMAYVAIAVVEQNRESLSDTIEFLKELGVPRDRIKTDCAWPLGRGANVSPADKSGTWVDKLARPVVDDRERLVDRTCWAGRIAVAPNGDVFVCVGDRKPLANVASDPLRTVVESKDVRSLWRITLDDVLVCRDCEFRYACFDCRAYARLLSGDLLGRDPTCPYDPGTGQWRHEDAAMDERPKRRENLVVEEMDDDLLIADFSGAQLHTLNPTAAIIWEMCDGEHSDEQIAEQLAGHFQLPIEQVQRDVQEVLRQFGEKGLLE